jgi:hypothetical protein
MEAMSSNLAFVDLFKYLEDIEQVKTFVYSMRTQKYFDSIIKIAIVWFQVVKKKKLNCS